MIGLINYEKLFKNPQVIVIKFVHSIIDFEWIQFLIRLNFNTDVGNDLPVEHSNVIKKHNKDINLNRKIKLTIIFFSSWSSFKYFFNVKLIKKCIN